MSTLMELTIVLRGVPRPAGRLGGRTLPQLRPTELRRTALHLGITGAARVRLLRPALLAMAWLLRLHRPRDRVRRRVHRHHLRADGVAVGDAQRSRAGHSRSPLKPAGPAKRRGSAPSGGQTTISRSAPPPPHGSGSQLAQDRLHVPAHRLGRQEQPLGDLGGVVSPAAISCRISSCRASAARGAGARGEGDPPLAVAHIASRCACHRPRQGRLAGEHPVQRARETLRRLVLGEEAVGAGPYRLPASRRGRGTVSTTSGCAPSRSRQPPHADRAAAVRQVQVGQHGVGLRTVATIRRASWTPEAVPTTARPSASSTPTSPVKEERMIVDDHDAACCSMHPLYAACGRRQPSAGATAGPTATVTSANGWASGACGLWTRTRTCVTAKAGRRRSSAIRVARCSSRS